MIARAGDRAERARRLRLVATGLLVAMAALFLFATWAMRALSPEFVWVQAFAEAALVGGLADWFAVTALFRHPMGLPIPHTAIIPKSKDRIGEALGRFLQENFLTARNVARRLEGLDLSGALARILERPATGGRVRQGLVRLMGQLAESEAGQAVALKLREGATRRLAEMEVAPLLGRMLSALLAEGRHRPLLDQLIGWSARTLDSQEGLIRAMVEERTSWVLRLVNVDTRIADELVSGLRVLLNDLAADPSHPVREKAERALENLAFDLQHLPETRDAVEQVKRDLLANPALGAWLEGLWSRLASSLGAALRGEGTGLSSVTKAMAVALAEDGALAQAVDQLGRRAIVGLVAQHGDQVARLVAETVKGWDAATVTEKMEAAVSRDLQYIRLNGTLIGGTIGVVLHALLVAAGFA